MLKFFIYAGMQLFTLNLLGQNITISGIVTEASTGERIAGANIFDSKLLKGTSANSFGFYSFSLPASDTVYLTVAMIGYDKYSLNFSGQSDKEVNIQLQNSKQVLSEVVITDYQNIEDKTSMSTLEISMEQIKQLPTFMGETDVLKSFQLMPGVQAGKEGNNGLYVRGGSPDQNLILLDDIPLYFVSHLGGFTSIFDANAISHVKLIKGGFPARYGGRLSSVVDIRMKDGNENKTKGTFSIGTLVSKISLEGPLINKKTTYFISLRRSFFDLFSRAFNQLMSPDQASAWYNLYDAYFKICHQVTEKDRVFLSFYSGNDKIGIQSSIQQPLTYNTSNTQDYNAKITWGNFMASMRWNHIYNNRLFGNGSIAFTRFNYGTEINGETKSNTSNAITESVYSNFHSGINDFIQKLDFEYYPNEKHKIKFGNAAIVHFFTPGVTSFKEQRSNTPKVDLTVGSNNNLKAYEFYIYGEDEYTLTSKISLNAGVHVSSYTTSGKPFFSAQPRISANYKIIEKTAVKASFVTMQQALHLLSNSGGGFPTDLWVPATKKVLPQKSMQVALGVVRTMTLKKAILDISLESYYKTLSNLIEFAEGASFFNSSKSWEEKVVTEGNGKVYGIEFMIQKKEGRITGWFGYTISKNIRQFDNLNQGKNFPYRYDRRNDLSLVVNFQINERISLSSSWVYGTGNAITLGTEKYGVVNYDYNYAASAGPLPFVTYTDAHVYSSRNGYRMPDYHKMDAGINFYKKLQKGERIWNISLYNVYNRQNAYLLYFKTVKNQNKLYQLSMFPIIPSFSYLYKF